MNAGDWKDMFLAAENGDVELVRHHLVNGVDPTLHSDLEDLTPLQAARQVRMNVVEARLRTS